MKFQAKAKNGGLVFASNSQREQFKKYLKENDGVKLLIENITSESVNQRKFYHGALLPLWAYLDGKNYKDSDVLDQMHQIAKQEFNGEVIVVNNKAHKVSKSTKGLLNKGFLDRVTEYLEENYGIKTDRVLDPNLYKKFRDEIYPYADYEDFIEYLIDLKVIK